MTVPAGVSNLKPASHASLITSTATLTCGLAELASTGVILRFIMTASREKELSRRGRRSGS